mgnify:CR=1 FL=1
MGGDLLILRWREPKATGYYGLRAPISVSLVAGVLSSTLLWFVYPPVNKWALLLPPALLLILALLFAVVEKNSSFVEIRSDSVLLLKFAPPRTFERHRLPYRELSWYHLGANESGEVSLTLCTRANQRYHRVVREQVVVDLDMILSMRVKQRQS